MENAIDAIRNVERALKDAQSAWNTAEGRRGHIAENRDRLTQEQTELEAQREILRQEQWKTRKESAALQHARDEAETLSEQATALQAEREDTRRQLRTILTKVKNIGAELRR